MRKRGLVFIENKKPIGSESFICKKLYRFIPEFDTFQTTGEKLKKRAVKIYIELEIYEYKICVISFYNEGFGEGKKKYRVRCSSGPGHIKAIVRACIEAYDKLIDADGHHAFIFSAADDLGEHKEHNKRYSMYVRFIDDNFKDRHRYQEDGSIQLNTFKLVHEDHAFKNECEQFYLTFNELVEREINILGGDENNK